MSVHLPLLREPDVFVQALLGAPDMAAVAVAAVRQASDLGAVQARVVWNSQPGQSAAAWASHPRGTLEPELAEWIQDGLRKGSAPERDAGGGLVDSLSVLASGRGIWAVLLARRPAALLDDPEHRLGWGESLSLLALRCHSVLHTERLQVDVDRLGRAERLQRALFAISDIASSDLDTPQVLHGLHEIVGRLMYAENFYIVRYDPERETMRFIYFADSQDPVTPDPDELLPAAEMGNSLTLALMRHGRPALGPSTEVRRRLGVERDDALGPDSEDWLGVPMIDEGVVRGAVVVQSYDPSVRYSDEDAALLGYVAQHILTALARRDAQEELERRVEERTRELRQEVRERQRSESLQAALFRIAELASRSESIEAFYADVHGIVSGLLDARNFFIALLTDDGQELDFPYSVDERDAKRPRRRLARGLTEYVLATGEPLLADRDAIGRLVDEGKLQSFGTPSVCWLGVPLLIDDQPVGVIAVQSYTPEYLYSWRDQELLSFVSLHIANALERRRGNESLRMAYADLEQRVAARTSELADTNRELLDQITVRERMELKLKHEAMHDTLTGLPNRAHLLGRLGLALARFKRKPQHLFSVLFLDLDRFKVVNDSVGHLVGDELLKEAAQRLARCVRDPDMVARLGGDEFAVVLDHIQSSDDAIMVAERIIKALAEPMRIAGKELYTSASIGIALADERYRSPEELLRDADVAMYRAKTAGRQRYALFDEQLHEAALRLLELEGDLRRAVQRQEFEPYYQPIVRLGDGALVGFEALVRWHHPSRGLVGPEQFLTVAEETGALEQIDWLVYERVCRDLRRLSGRNLYATINVSPRHLRGLDFDKRLLDLLEQHRIRPAQIRLEVTEGALLEQPEDVQACLARLRHAGVLTMLDDFGTGYSSLSYLHRFPLYGLKIDRSFVADLRSGESGGSTAIVRAIRLLADSLGLEVIAEGIESEDQRQQLRLLGLTMGQGYLFSPPVSADEVIARHLAGTPN